MIARLDRLIEIMKPQRHGQGLLPGNAKNRGTTELPAMVALSALGTEWQTMAHLSELQAMGLLWHLISGASIGLAVHERIGVIAERGAPDAAGVALPEDIAWLRVVIPPIVGAIRRTPNIKLEAAIRKAQELIRAQPA